MIYDPVPSFFDPKKKNLGQKSISEVVAVATPSRTEDGFIAAEKRATHWLGVWETFWSGK